MHPIERLRYVARSTGGDPRLLVSETAGALRGLQLDAGGLVVACRRIVERHPTSGPLWWLCAHVVTAPDAMAASRRCVDEISEDPTAVDLAHELPDEAVVVVAGWPDLAADALVRRGDVRVLVVDVGGEGDGFARRLARAEVEAEVVTPEGGASAAVCADVVLLEAAAVGPDAALCPVGSLGLAATAYCAEVPVWLVAGRGRRLPEALWRGMLERLGDAGEPWEHEVEQVPLSLVSVVAGPDGVVPAMAADLGAECPPAVELLRTSAI